MVLSLLPSILVIQIEHQKADENVIMIFSQGLFLASTVRSNSPTSSMFNTNFIMHTSTPRITFLRAVCQGKVIRLHEVKSIRYRCRWYVVRN